MNTPVFGQIKSFTNGYANVNGLKLYYEIHGHGIGEPLVILHGGGSTINTTFGKVLPDLASRRRIIAIELQAHGHTKDVNRPLSFQQDADDVYSLLRELEIKKVDILGFSNGGNTAMQVAIRHPEIVRKLIVGSSFFKREGIYPFVWNFIKQGTIDTMPKQLQEAYLAINNDKEGLKIMHDRDRQRMLDFQDWPKEEIQSIKAETMLVISDNDVVKPEHAIEMYRIIKGCKLAVIPGGHGEYLGEVTVYKKESKLPQFFVSLVDDFLK